MQLNFSYFLNLLFPQSEDEVLVSQCSREVFLRKATVELDNGVTSLSSFRDETIRAAIHLNKFHAHPHAQILLAALLEKYLQTLPQMEFMLIPVPLSSQRHRKRGYNQVTNVAFKASRGFPNIAVKENILKRMKDTKPQTSLSKMDRLQNMKGAFGVLPYNQKLISGSHIILLDDVCTTGATLKEAKATIMILKPASLQCVCLAR